MSDTMEDLEMAQLRKEANQNRYELRLAMIIAVGVVTVILGIVASITVCSLRTAELRSECIAAGGTWAGGNCVP